VHIYTLRRYSSSISLAFTGDSECFRLAADGIVELVDRFLTVGMANRVKTTQYPMDPCAIKSIETSHAKMRLQSKDIIEPWWSPDATFILQIYGPALFGIANTQMNVRDKIFKEGRASALGCLCRIFTQQNGQKIDDADLSKFYTTVIQALAQEQNTQSRIVYAILLNSTMVFNCGLKGSTVLIPMYMHHLENIFFDRTGKFGSKIRRSALRIVSSLIPLKFHLFDKSTLLAIRERLSKHSNLPNMPEDSHLQNENQYPSRAPSNLTTPSTTPEVVSTLSRESTNLTANIASELLSDTDGLQSIPSIPDDEPPAPTGEAPPPPNTTAPPPPMKRTVQKRALSDLSTSTAFGTRKLMDSSVSSVESKFAFLDSVTGDFRRRKATKEITVPGKMIQMQTTLKFVDLVPRYLMEALRTESDMHNKEILLWMIMSFLHECAKCPFGPSSDLSRKTTLPRGASTSNAPKNEYEFPELKVLINTTIDHIWKGVRMIRGNGVWNAHLRTVAFSVLSEMASIHDTFKWALPGACELFLKQLSDFIETYEKKGSQAQSSFVHVRAKTTGAGAQKYATISEFGFMQLENVSSIGNPPENELCAATMCLFKWIEKAPWALSNEKITLSVNKALIAAIKYGNEKTRYICLQIERLMLREVGKHTSYVHPLATPCHPKHALHERLKHEEKFKYLSDFGSMSHLHENRMLSSSLGEAGILRELTHKKIKHSTHYFCLDAKTLLSLIEYHVNGGPRLVAVIRDVGGKYVWSCGSVLERTGRRPSKFMSNLVTPEVSFASSRTSSRSTFSRDSPRSRSSPRGSRRGHRRFKGTSILGKIEEVRDLLGASLQESWTQAKKATKAGQSDATFLDSTSAYKAWEKNEDAMDTSGADIKSRTISEDEPMDASREFEDRVPLLEVTAERKGSGCARPKKVTPSATARSVMLARILLSSLGFLRTSIAPKTWTDLSSLIISMQKVIRKGKIDVPEFKAIRNESARAETIFDRLVPLQNKPLLKSELKSLDSMSERDVMTISVLLRNSNQNCQKDMCANETGPADYNDFLRKLGTSVKLEQHPGFKGGLTREDARYSPYFADMAYEMMFLVPTLMIAPHHRRQNLVNTSFVHVIWSTDSTSFNPDFYAKTPENKSTSHIRSQSSDAGSLDEKSRGSKHRLSTPHQPPPPNNSPKITPKETNLIPPSVRNPCVYIVIHPQPYGLYRVRTYTRGFPPPPRKRAVAENSPKQSSSSTMQLSSSMSTFNIFGGRKEEKEKPDEASRKAAKKLEESVGHLNPRTIFGPLLDDTVVNKASLGFLVRSTCVHAWQYTMRYNSSVATSYKPCGSLGRRARAIAALARTHTDFAKFRTIGMLNYLFEGKDYEMNEDETLRTPVFKHSF